jgi:hypothetical protein
MINRNKTIYCDRETLEAACDCKGKKLAVGGTQIYD